MPLFRARPVVQKEDFGQAHVKPKRAGPASGVARHAERPRNRVAIGVRPCCNVEGRPGSGGENRPEMQTKWKLHRSCEIEPMPVVKVRWSNFRLQIVIIRREQKDARPVRRHVVCELRKNILPVPLEALSPSSAKGQRQSVSSEERG